MPYDTFTLDQFHKKFIAPTLFVIGFEYQGNGCYFNILLQKRFDFSSYSLEGCIVAIYKEGLAQGKKETQEQIKTALGL